MKKLLILALLALLVSLGAWALIASKEAVAKNNFAPGTVIKGKHNSTVYYLGEDGKRYVFPNANTYFSWFDDFNNVEEVDDEELPDYPLGGNVTYRPGVVLIKIQTDPKVYAVSLNGLLRWIRTEAIATSLYGENWNLLVDDVPDSFFQNYQIGDPINDDENYDPDEEEEQAPSISYNLRLKHQQKIIERIRTRQQKICERLQRSLNRLQRRLARWGMELPDVGSGYLNQCVPDDDQDDNEYDECTIGKKIIICHIPPGDPENPQTLIVSKSSARAHLAHGDTLCACEAEPGGGEEDDTSAPVITNINADEGTTTATITWETDEIANSKVEYATSSPLKDADILYMVIDEDDVTSHSVALEDLMDNTTYYFRVISTDPSENTASSSGQSFTTREEVEPDTTAPEITDVLATNIGSTTATITWTTDEASDSKVVYATSTPVDDAYMMYEESDSSDVTSHSVDLMDLATSTMYYFRVESEDASSNLATSTESSFTTLAE